MGQTIDKGLNNINIAESYMMDSRVQTWKDSKENNNSISQATNEGGLGYSYVQDKENSSLQNTVMDNFEEYLKTKQEKAKEEGVDEASQRKQEKEESKEIARNLSSEEIAQLEMMGIDISTASLDDIMGMVNTMRGNSHREEMKTMLAQIAASNGDLDGFTMVGGNVKIAGTDVELSDVSVTDVVTNKEPVEDFKILEDELAYIIKNNLPVTEESLYKAHYSGSKAMTGFATEKLMEEMLPQIEKIIEQAGYEVNEESLAGAKFLMDNQLPVNPENIKAYMDFQDIKGKMVSELEIPDVSRIKEEKVTQLYNDVKSLHPGMAYEMAAEGKTITIASLIKYSKNHTSLEYNKKAIENYSNKDELQLVGDSQDIKAVTAMRQVEELRLSMTMEASYRLVNQDINIDTKEVSQVVAKLRDMENQLIANKLKKEEIAPTEENISLYKEVDNKISSLGQLHARVLASPVKGGDFTVNGFYEEAATPVDEKTFETVRRSYEAVGTAPRYDMGDSISKAFSNVKDILEEMKLPINTETERAVRILGYNSLEITEENINQIINIDRQVNDLINGFYPEAVLGMIKDGINPLDMNIDELNRKIKNKNYNKGVSEADNFASYLRDMEAMGQITPEERESYIGIYRVINRLEKSGDREAGWLFANDSRLTVRNFISAMRSRRASGIDISVDDDFGMLEQLGVKGNLMDEQIGKAFEKNVDVDKLEEMREELDTLINASQEVEKIMLENHIEITSVNVAAANYMLENPGGIYQLVSDILGKMKFKTNITEELVDEETENIKDSLSGEDVDISFSMDSILESLKGREEMSFKYEDLRDKLTQLMYSASLTGSITSKDISLIKTANAGFNVMSSMAKNNRYQIPVKTEEGVRVVNLTINHSEEKKGTVEISMSTEKMGNISGLVVVGDEGALEGYIVSDSSDGNYALMEKQESIIKILENAGYNTEAISVGSYGQTKEGGKAVDEEALYKVSVALVKSFGVVN